MHPSLYKLGWRFNDSGYRNTLPDLAAMRRLRTADTVAEVAAERAAARSATIGKLKQRFTPGPLTVSSLYALSIAYNLADTHDMWSRDTRDLVEEIQHRIYAISDASREPFRGRPLGAPLSDRC